MMATARGRLFARRSGVFTACTATGAGSIGPTPAGRAIVVQSVDHLGGRR